MARSTAENGWNYWQMREGLFSCLISGSIHLTNVKRQYLRVLEEKVLGATGYEEALHLPLSIKARDYLI